MYGPFAVLSIIPFLPDKSQLNLGVVASEFYRFT